MFTQFLGAAATVYGVLGALKTLLQTRQMLARRSSRNVSAGFLASYTGGYRTVRGGRYGFRCLHRSTARRASRGPSSRSAP